MTPQDPLELLDPTAWTNAQALLVVLLAMTVAVAAWRLARREYQTAATRTVAYAVVLAALASALGHLSVTLPGGAKPAPAQHMVNVMAAVLTGPWWAMLIAFTAAVVRNAAGTGSPLAFPGGMIGALLAGLAWRWARTVWTDRRGELLGIAAAAVGEIVGTGIIAALVSAALVAPAIMGSQFGLMALVVPFLASTLLGTVIGLAALLSLRSADVIDLGTTR